MIIHHNYLRICRKRSGLTQADVAYLMGLPGDSNLSRCENGLRTPSIDMLLTYYLLFDASIETFFPKQKNDLQAHILSQIRSLLETLRAEPETPQVARRIAFLEEVFIRLSNSNTL